MTSLVPRQPVPELEVPTVGGDAWKLSESAPENFAMVVFYRGLHCPICAGYLGDLDRKRDDFRGVGHRTPVRIRRRDRAQRYPVRAAVRVLRQIEAVARLRCQTAFNIDPLSACKIDPPERHGGGCPGSQ